MSLDGADEGGHGWIEEVIEVGGWRWDVGGKGVRMGLVC